MGSMLNARRAGRISRTIPAGGALRTERLRALLRASCLVLLLLPAGCGGEPVRMMTFAMDGPPLAVAGEQEAAATSAASLDGEAEPESGAETVAAWQGSETGALEPAGGAPVPPTEPGSIERHAGAVAGRTIRYEGEMERSCMVGNGRFKLVNLENGETCAGEVNSGPSAKGRIRGIVSCGAGRFFLFTLSNHGPDQGAGVGRFAAGSGEAGDSALELEIEEGPPLLFFCHPWMEESKRRLADMQKNLASSLQSGGK